MLEVRMLPARFGDSIWVEYGHGDERRRILIDGGTGRTREAITAMLEALPAEERRFELLTVSHIDRDHIEGVLGLLEEQPLRFEVGEVWFNGYPQLPDTPEDEMFGAKQGERLTQAILQHELPWNRRFGGKAVAVPDAGELPRVELDGGAVLTLLQPTTGALAKLKGVWEKELLDAGLVPGFGLDANDGEDGDGDEEFGGGDLPDVEALAATPFEPDASKANASSIAFLFEFEGKRLLFAADAHADKLAEALERLSPGEPLAIDLFKLSHHGSKKTVSRELVEKVRCSRFVFSTNGSIFGHPHPETVARVLAAGGETPELIFNYRSAHNKIWDLGVLKGKHRYRTRYPADGGEGIVIGLE